MDDIIQILSIQPNDKEKWVKYYNLETYKYYDYILNIIPNNQNILEIGSGGGVFYNKNKDILVKRNNKYTCIDIDECSIEYSKENCDYVNFYIKDANELSDEELKSFDILLLVQSYMVINNSKDLLKRYFDNNPNGCVMIVYTSIPDCLVEISNMIRNILSNSKMSYGRSITLNEIDELGKYLNKKITNINICKNLIQLDEYLTIIR